ncbi:MAG: N4-gp56 family major capsid protein [Pseudomonadota bacterium]
MAATEFGLNDPETVKLWSRKLAREAFAQTWFKKLVGKEGSEDEDNAIIVEKTDTKKDAGDEVTCTLRMQLEGDGVLGDATLEGNEESITTFTDKLVINQLRHAVRSKGKMSEQRIPWKHRKEAMKGLRDWWSTRWDRCAFVQLCGYTGPRVVERGEIYSGQDVRYSGNNATIAPDSTSHYRLDATNGLVSNANDEDLVAADTMTLTVLDDLKAEAETRAPIIRPVMFEGEKVYVVILDTFQARDLRTNTNTGQWQDIQKAAMQGGNVKKNPIFTGALGMYNNMILHSSNRITQGVNSSTGANISTARRAVFLGAGAGMIGFGQGHSLEKYDWHEDLFDYGNQLGVKGGCIGGLKKTQYDNKDYGCLVLSTYAATSAT